MGKQKDGDARCLPMCFVNLIVLLCLALTGDNVCTDRNTYYAISMTRITLAV